MAFTLLAAGGPNNTRVAYSTRLMVRLASIPQVKGFKMDERDILAAMKAALAASRVPPVGLV